MQQKGERNSLPLLSFEFLTYLTSLSAAVASIASVPEMLAPVARLQALPLALKYPLFLC